MMDKENKVSMDRFGEPLPRKVAIFRALQLGDMLCIVPALRALRGRLPQAEITLIGLPWAKTFVERFDDYLDNFLEFPGYPGLPEQPFQPQKFTAFLNQVWEKPFDLSIQMQGNGTITNSLIGLLQAKKTAGFYVPGQYCPDETLFLPYPEEEREVRKHLQLMEFLGAPVRGEELEFPLRLSDWEELNTVKEARDLRPGEYVCLHPGARAFARRWPAECFAQVGDYLAGRGLRVVLTGSNEEARLVQEVSRMMRQKAVNLAGKTSLGGLAALLNGARLLVSNDTGVSHLGAALRIPSVIIFSASSPASWAPSNRELHRIVANPDGVRLETVLVQVNDLLEKERQNAA